MKHIWILVAGITACPLLSNGQDYIKNQFGGPQEANLFISGTAKIGADYTGTRGAVSLHPGDAGNAGFVEFFRPNGVRKGIIGYGNDYTINYSGENGTNHVFTEGNVGIGVPNPTSKLDVNGVVNASDMVRSAHAMAVAAPNGNYSILAWDVSTNYTPYVGTINTGADFAIWSGNAEQMRITKEGNVGIGTVLPQSKLAVKGTITSTRVKVTQDNWADFVFDPGYQLPSLTHIEKFIQENKRLPEIPSAAEVKEHGLDVGDNQAKLLQKIEELTLYLIEQSKQLQAQQNLLQSQDKKLKELELRLNTVTH
ncbi:hypothetical protein [Chitinophaga sp. HK235]|uniref:hypothetical protein n=1 Tax=Chitinophaga sp. HK235 TaxID=2952571 RepID=UPI001BA71379|nr:hypothetical protein [Chitinophaga sp. HK235]